MAIGKTALRVTELDFDSIKNNLKNYLRSQPEFTDFDFEGSGMSVLLDILAYNTHYMGYYLNMVGNEMFLDTAQIRNSILSHAKLLNYVPGSNQGALNKINIKVTPSNAEDQSINLLTIDKYTRLLGRDVDGVNYPFITLYSNTAPKVTGTFNFENVFVKQGELITRQYLIEPTNTTRRYEIPSANVDTSTIFVNVQESSSNTDTKNYTLAEDITELTGNSNVYFIEENENSNYTIYFGDGYIGRRPRDGNIVIVSYLDNVGQLSNNISNFVFAEPLGDKFSDNVIVTSVGSSYGGVDKETIEEVRFRAPYYYNTQNRAVTKLDYQTLLLKDYSFIDSVAIWGGEENDPVVYGKVFISLKTKGNYELTNFEIERIKDEIIRKRNVLTVIPEIIQPTFEFLNIKGTVNYDSKLTSLTSNQILERIKAAIFDYNSNELNKFESIYRKSTLQQYIEAADPSIISSDIDIYLQKRVKVDPNFARPFDLQWNIPIHRLTNSKRISTFPAIQISDFTGIQREAFFEETPVTESGVYSVETVNGGFGYLNPPAVQILGDGSGAIATATVAAGSITKITVNNPGQNYTDATVSISGGGGSGAFARVRLQSELNNMRSFYYKGNGEKVIINSNAAQVDYVNGTIKVPETRIFGAVENDFYEENVWSFTVPLEKDTVFPSRNRILSIDENDPRAILIEMIAEA